MIDALREVFAFPWQGVAGFLVVVGMIAVAMKIGWQRTKDWFDLPEKVAELGTAMSTYVKSHELEARQWRNEYLNHIEHPPKPPTGRRTRK